MNGRTPHERTLRYVSSLDLEPWLRVGWLVVGHYRSFGNGFDSFILEWKCECPPGLPGSHLALDRIGQKGDNTPHALSPLE